MKRKDIGEARVKVSRVSPNKGKPIWTMDLLTGKTVLALVQCKTCLKSFPHDSFYLKSISTRKHDSDVRSDCVDCYDMKDKARDTKPEYNPDMDLVRFIK